MEKSYLSEAFKSLELLEEEDFNVNDIMGIADAKEFVNTDDNTDIVDIIDPEAETEEDVKDSYIGKVICDCCVCHSLVYKNPDEIILSEDDEIANEGEECPFCYSNDGYKIVGQVAPFGGTEEPEKGDEGDEHVEGEDEPKPEKEEDDKKEESLQESIKRVRTKKLNEGGLGAGVGGAGGAALGGLVGGPVGAVVGGALGAIGGNALDNVNEVFEGLPEMCYVDTYTDGIGLVKRGESGYYKTDLAQTNGIDISNTSKIRELVDMLNDRLGVTPAQAEAMKTGSMFGWDVPGANPEDEMVKKIANNSRAKAEEALGEEKKHDKAKELLKVSKHKPLDAKGTKQCSVCGKVIDGKNGKKTSKSLNSSLLSEGVDEVEVKADGQKVEVKPDEDGKLKIEIGKCEECAEENAEVIAPLEPEVKDEIELNSDDANEEPIEEPKDIDFDVDEFDEDSFKEVGEGYLKEVYDNVDNFDLTGVKSKGNTLTLEGKIKFSSGNEKNTKFVFEAKSATKKGKLKFIGENCQISKGKKSFTLTGSLENNKFIAESLNYNYKAKNGEGKSVRLYGTIKKSK